MACHWCITEPKPTAFYLIMFAIIISVFIEAFEAKSVAIILPVVGAAFGSRSPPLGYLNR